MKTYILLTNIITQRRCDMFEKIMYKVKDNTFRIQDFTKRDNVDESKFVEGKSQRGKKQLQVQVCILYPDEYNDIKTKFDAHKSQVQHLKAMISERESEIIRLKKQINEKEQANSEVKQLKEDISNITQDHEKEVSKLHQEKAMLEKSHLEDLNKLKETHANQLSAIDETHKNEIKKLEEQYNAKLDKANDKLLSEVQANNQTIDKLKDEITSLHQEKSKIEKDYIADMKALESEHANEKIELTKAHQDEVTNLKEDISQIKQDYLKQINENNQTHYYELDSEKKKVYQAKENYLALTIHNNENDDMYFEKLENLGRFEKFLNKDKKIIKEMRERNRLKVDDNYIEGKIKEIKGN